MKKLPTRAAAQIHLIEKCHSIIVSDVIDFCFTGSLDQSIISTLLKLVQTERNNISKHKNQKGQKWNDDSYLSLSLLVLIFCCHALKLLPLPLAKTDTGLVAPHVLVFLTVATSQYLKWCAISPLASPPSFHTTSGAVGLPPSSGGGLRCCILQHISEKDPPQDEDRLRWQVCV